ncbi:MAG: iron ABC transporter permease [Gammaproteobacteria bacterium]|nr:iron ABC transporter permease [Gammaproteobacteria bacterium]
MYSHYIHRPLLVGALVVALLVLACTGLVIGPVHLPFGVAFGALLEPGSPEGLIVADIRLPRILLSAMVGATLGLAGAALQGLLRNPLAEPGIIGTSGFAALGAVITLYFGIANVWFWSQPLAGVLGAIAGILLLLAIAGRIASVLTLILTGVALSSLAGACVALALNLSPNPFAALEIAFWLLGSFEDRSMLHLALAIVPMVLSWLILLRCGRVLDALTLGEDVARTLGFGLDRARLEVVAGVGLGVGAAVAVSGVIGFVGLVTPHLLRPFVGHQSSALLLPSAIGGACLLLAADNLVRVLPTSSELKVGVVTALIGVPFFIMLVIRARRHLI